MFERSMGAAINLLPTGYIWVILKKLNLETKLWNDVSSIKINQSHLSTCK